MKTSKIILLCLLSLTLLAASGCSKDDEKLSAANTVTAQAFDHNDELNPFDPNIENTLNELDAIYGNSETNLDAPFFGNLFANTCRRHDCKVYIEIDLSEQLLRLYVDQQFVKSWLVSSGAVGYGTPLFDRNPNGRIYDKYSSSKYPGGDYNGLGNMPYAIFIEGGFALHGTPKSNWSKLGTRASHGCVRMHPDNALIVNRLVRQHGIYNTWIRIVQ